jgi:hypothetical protein
MARRYGLLLVLGLFLVAAASTSAEGTEASHVATANVSRPTLSGKVAAGGLIAAHAGSWSNLGGTYGYQWQRCNPGGGGCNPIVGATGHTYRVRVADARHTLRVLVVAANAAGSSVASSAASRVAAATAVRPAAAHAQATTPALFDGRASATAALDPHMWACLCFTSQDIALQSDPRFGRVYAIDVGPGSHNPWWTPPYGIASAEVSVRRPVRLGEWDWYANSYKALPGWTLTDWGTVSQMNYPTIASPPLEVDFDKYGVGIERTVGYVATHGGTPQVHDVQRWFPVSRVVGKWLDVVIGVKWATDTSGAIRVYTRCHECGDTQWVLRYTKDNILTMQWGAGVMNQNGTSAQDGQPMTTLDKEGVYYGYASGHAPSSLPTNRMLQMGLIRTTSEAAAMAAFGD